MSIFRYIYISTTTLARGAPNRIIQRAHKNNEILVITHYEKIIAIIYPMKKHQLRMVRGIRKTQKIVRDQLKGIDEP